MFYWQVDRPFDEAETKKVFLDRHQNFNSDLARQAIESGMVQAGKAKSKARAVKLYEMIPFGSVNVVIKAKLADGTLVIFRGHPPEVKNGYFWAESLAAKKAREVGVPAYKTYFIDDTRDKFNFDYMLTEYLPGRNMKDMWPIAKKLDQKLIEDTGKLLAKIHTIHTKNFGFFDNRLAKAKKQLVGIQPQWSDHVLAALTKNLNYLQKTQVITPSQRKKISKIFSANKTLLDYKRSVLIQNDLADWNQLAQNGRVTAVLDWDECHSGDPMADFACWSLFFPLERLEHLKRGYQQISPLPKEYEAKFHLLRLRYLVSKITLRKKKLTFKEDKFMRDLLNHGLKTMKQEFSWYGL
ncbi:hypothetical protein A3J22_02315 [Candidatus Beckwithbacteria bacterium RIFCSPLOWO2_02_FULL_49_12]|nr:MAG: hypothetical protein A2877_04460 [Candidatus Beckwithbacteria bacterium RIFCSPHIGHO2_01_FULL_49_39]OGD57664.1 MAG: hypothetical protein A3J22_02315 [Candidatus Beckwithbacteria bacterium RIFCSPLOWO2_02_FULL_49_12]